jgi:hypothetical protein
VRVPGDVWDVTDKVAALSGPFYHGTKTNLKRGDPIAAGRAEAIGAEDRAMAVCGQ